jgi:hypothetical protein
MGRTFLTVKLLSQKIYNQNSSIKVCFKCAKHIEIEDLTKNYRGNLLT